MLDVLLDGRRIWSVRPGPRRSSRARSGASLAAQSSPSSWTVSPTSRCATPRGPCWHEAELHLREDSADRATLVDRNGNPMAVDGAGRLVRTFEAKDSAELEPLLDAMTEVLGALARAAWTPSRRTGRCSARCATATSSVTTTTPTSPT